MRIARRFVVSGWVQGVGYRWFAIRAAERCGIAGSARNVLDGTVEVFAEGEAEAVAAFRAELEQGPRAGRVEYVFEEEVPVAGRHGFHITG